MVGFVSISTSVVLISSELDRLDFIEAGELSVNIMFFVVFVRFVALGFVVALPLVGALELRLDVSGDVLINVFVAAI